MTEFKTIATVTKRNGETEAFDVEKLVKWAAWAKNKLGNRVKWQAVFSDVMNSLYDSIPTEKIQDLLIERLLQDGDWASQKMAGALWAPMLHKKIYGDNIPTVYELHKKLQGLELMKKLPYTKKEYDIIETFINHQDDFDLAHFQLKQIHRKYSVQNRVTGECYEMPQFTYMRMAMEIMSQRKDNRLFHVRKMFEHLKRTINAPTPNYTSLGTKNTGLLSCAVSIAGDTIASLSTTELINYRLTAIGSGIGTYIQSRSIGDPVRGGAIEHNGKVPYFAASGKNVKANMQGARAGAATNYYDCFDPEASTIAMLQNPRTPEMRRNRDTHFAVKYHPLFLYKAALNEDVFTFNIYTAPDLMEAFHGKDKYKFKELYERYEQDENFKKNYVNARDLLVMFEQQSYDVGTHYEYHVHNANFHTPFKEKIHSSNLCDEINEVNHPYEDAYQLYHEGYFYELHFQDKAGKLHKYKQNDDVFVMVPEEEEMEGYSCKVGDLEEGMAFVDKDGQDHYVKKVVKRDQQPEVAFCSLAGIVEPAVLNDEDYEEACYYAMYMIDYTIENSSFAFPHMAFTARARRNAGLGLLGAATTMARKGLRYDTTEGLNQIHRMAERHAYFSIKASLRLGQELGNARWMHKTKWPEGWLPIDTYSKEVDAICSEPLHYPWEPLRQAIIANRGLRFSVNNAHMPTESSSKAAGYPNSWYPVREVVMAKSDGGNVMEWAATDSDILGDNYQSAWTLSSRAAANYGAVIQKFTDQGFSADEWNDRTRDIDLSATQLCENVIYRARMGLKGRYYNNSKTDSGETETDAGCGSGGCKL